jgi:hypothetical protein
MVRTTGEIMKARLEAGFQPVGQLFFIEILLFRHALGDFGACAA